QTMVSARDASSVQPSLVMTERVLYVIKTLTPKTRETTNLLDRSLFTDKDLQDTLAADTAAPPAPSPRTSGRGPGRNGPFVPSQVAARLELERQRSPWWIIGTSLIFEAVALALAAWYFCTRDF